MASKKVWSGVLPLAILLALVGALFAVGRIGSEMDETIVKEGIETVGVIVDESKRMVRLNYKVESKDYTTGVGKPHSYFKSGEQYVMKYLSDDPKDVVVFFDKPILSDEYDYSVTSCKSMSKSFSVIDFQYEVDGKLIKREAPFKGQSMNPEEYVVKYRVSDPEIGYLMEK